MPWGGGGGTGSGAGWCDWLTLSGSARRRCCFNPARVQDYQSAGECFVHVSQNPREAAVVLLAELPLCTSSLPPPPPASSDQPAHQASAVDPLPVNS